MSDKIYYMGDGNLGPRGGKLYVFYCPGCGYTHPFEVDAPNGAGWEWNGSMDRPTFTPSLLVAGTIPEQRCHSVVSDGRIHFLSDSHHALAGKTVALPDWEEEEMHANDL